MPLIKVFWLIRKRGDCLLNLKTKDDIIELSKIGGTEEEPKKDSVLRIF